MDTNTTANPATFPRLRVVTSGVDACTHEQMTTLVLEWARERASCYGCFCNAHMLIEAVDDSAFQAIVTAADLVLPDGRAVVWMLRALGQRKQPQIRGPDAMRLLCAAAAAHGIKVGFYGSVDTVLDAIGAYAERDFPGLQISYRHAPPFRRLSPAEDEAIVAAVNESGVGLLFIGLGCPKQEHWMAEHRGRIKAVMLGVGAAFDFYAGRVPEAPRWISHFGFEWAYRLAREPRRLLGRNLRTSPRFAARAIMQLLTSREKRI